MAALVAAFYLVSLTALVALRWVDPLVTMVQAQRRIEAWVRGKPYSKRQQWAPLGRISPDLQHAVISAEDGRFFQHHGIDWKEVQKVVDQDVEDGRLGRGGAAFALGMLKDPAAAEEALSTCLLCGACTTAETRCPRFRP